MARTELNDTNYTEAGKAIGSSIASFFEITGLNFATSFST
jgi:hypothetical protein